MTSLHHAPVDDADGLAFGARDGVRLHKANLGGDAEEFLDAFLDALFALLEILDCVGEHRAVELDLHFDVVEVVLAGEDELIVRGNALHFEEQAFDLRGEDVHAADDQHVVAAARHGYGHRSRACSSAR